MPSSLPSLDVVIVNWNSGSYLRRCLESFKLTKLDGIALATICIVDNCSSDRSHEFKLPEDLPIELVRNPSNFGFARACNLGAARGRGEYILFLNPDTELQTNSLEGPLRFLDDETNRRFGICGIQLVDHRGSPAPCVSYFPTALGFLYKATGLSTLFKAAFPSEMLPGGYPTCSREVDQVIGAFMMTRRRVFEDLSGFDERFFVYFEDADFAYRAKTCGYASYFLKDATAFHKGNASSGQVKAKRLFYSLRSRLQYSKKHFTPIGYVLTVVMTTIMEPLARLTSATLRLSMAEVRETAQGSLLLYRWLIKSSVAHAPSRSSRS